jgi:hypothetical protein
MNYKAVFFSFLIISSVTVDSYTKSTSQKRSEDEQRPLAYVVTREAVKMAVLLPLLYKYLEVTNAYIKQSYPDEKSAQGAMAVAFQKLFAGTLLYATFEDALKSTRQTLNSKINDAVDTIVVSTIGA